MMRGRRALRIVAAAAVRQGGRRTRLVGGALLALVLAGCSGGSSARGASTASSTAGSSAASSSWGVLTGGSSTDAPVSIAPFPGASAPGNQAIAATAVRTYLAMWQDMVTAGTTADYASPHLGDHAAVEALSVLYHGLFEAHREGVVIKGQPTFAPVVTAMTPSAAPTDVSIVDCTDDSHWLAYLPDGRLQDNTPGGKHRATATVHVLDGQWFVTALQVEPTGTCT